MPRRVTKTKTFAGCWTCRRRKVKCDSRRPLCRRCGDSCEGYGVALHWIGGEHERPCDVKRKAMLIYDPRLPVQVDLQDIDLMLDELEAIVDVVGEGIVGAFSAFSFDEPEQLEIGDPSLLAESPNEMQLELVGGGGQVMSPPWEEAAELLLGDELSVHVDPAMMELMDNYIHVVADLMQPAQHTLNPYRSLYVPKAMDAAASSLLVGIGGTPSHVGTALLHALLAVSAFHMHRHCPSRARYNQGRLHRLKAIESLQLSITEADIDDSHTTMAAMLSMVSIDLMEGSMSDFWIHLDGCEKLLSVVKQNSALQSPGTDQLSTICSFMGTLSRSTDPYLPPKVWREQIPVTINDLFARSAFFPDNHSLEFTYGITATLASYMDLTISLSQHLRYYKTNQLTIPNSLEQAISITHDALTSWSITDEPLSSVPADDTETLSLLRCHILAFHAALVVYFYTITNWDTTHSSTASSSVSRADHNHICVTNLLAAEALKSSVGARSGWNAMAPIVWPGFIAACEAGVHERPLWRTWWVNVQRYCIGSIAILWGVVQEVWEDEDTCAEVTGPRWMAVLRRSGRRVMSGG